MNLEDIEIETLVLLVEQGPLFYDKLPSRKARDNLIEKGLAVKVIVRREEGHTGATYLGAEAYKSIFKSTSIYGGMANRHKDLQACILREIKSTSTH